MVTSTSSRPTPSPHSWVPVALPAALAVVAVLVAGMVGNIFAADTRGFSDGGALTRYGLPLARSLHHVFAALTIGLLLLAGTVLPHPHATRKPSGGRQPADTRHDHAVRLATGTGLAWILCGVATMLFSFSSQAGLPVTDPGLFPQFVGSVWIVEYFRAQFISVLLATTAVLGATAVQTRVGSTWMAGLALASLAPLALIGHAGGAADHDNAVNSLGIHLVALSVWLGGLAGILLLWRRLGADAVVVVQRYSVLAAWAFGAVVLSGLINSWIRIGGLDGLASTYGALLAAKAVTLVLLGVAGWWMRRRVIPTLPSGRSFVTLALGELAVMGTAIGIAAALARTPPPVSRAAPTGVDPAITLTGYPMPAHMVEGLGWITTWRIDWLWTAVAVVGAVLYIVGVLRLQRRGDQWFYGRTTSWLIGCVLLLWATSGAPGIYGRLMFSAHMILHMTLAMVIPLFLVFGAPLTLASRCLTARHDGTLGPRELLLQTAHSRYLSFWANPVVASVNFFGSLIVFYYSGLFELALRTHTGHMAMIIHFLLAGYMFCWVLVGVDPGPKRWPPSLRLLLLFVTMSSHAFFGVALISSTMLLAPDFFLQLKVPWVHNRTGDATSALVQDQIVGGAITWGFGELPMLVLAIAVAFVWMRSEEREAARKDRQADRDHDAELEAYNARLERQYTADHKTQERTSE